MKEEISLSLALSLRKIIKINYFFCAGNNPREKILRYLLHFHLFGAIAIYGSVRKPQGHGIHPIQFKISIGAEDKIIILVLLYEMKVFNEIKEQSRVMNKYCIQLFVSLLKLLFYLE